MKHRTIESLLEQSIPEPNTGCFLWLGPVGGSGYGRVWHSGRRWGAHRLLYVLARDDFDPALCVLHTCDVKLCVNPQHLRQGTMADNVRDMLAKGRGKKSKSGLPFGVRPAHQRWGFSAQVQMDGRLRYLGTFDTAEEASRVAAEFKQNTLKYGQFAEVNV